MSKYLGPGQWGLLSDWALSDCEHLRNLAGDIKPADPVPGRSGSDLLIAIHLNTVHWLIELENRVRAMEGRKPVRVGEADEPE